jgi:hypothetical protein
MIQHPIGFMLTHKRRQWLAVALFAKSKSAATKARKQWSATIDPNTIAGAFEIEEIAISEQIAYAATYNRACKIGSVRIPLLNFVAVRDQVPA